MTNNFTHSSLQYSRRGQDMRPNPPHVTYALWIMFRDDVVLGGGLCRLVWFYTTMMLHMYCTCVVFVDWFGFTQL